MFLSDFVVLRLMCCTTATSNSWGGICIRPQRLWTCLPAYRIFYNEMERCQNGALGSLALHVLNIELLKKLLLLTRRCSLRQNLATTLWTSMHCVSLPSCPAKCKSVPTRVFLSYYISCHVQLMLCNGRVDVSFLFMQVDFQARLSSPGSLPGYL